MNSLLEIQFRSYRKALSEKLVEIGAKNQDIVVLDADLTRSTGTWLFAERFPERFFNMGISEQDMISTAAGLSIGGKIPIVATFSVFLLRAFEQIRNTIARDHLNVKMIGTHAGISAINDGSSHQCIEDIAALRALPNLTIVSPADDSALKVLLEEAIDKIFGPVYFRIGRDNAIPIYDSEPEIQIGKPNILEEGHDIVILSHGTGVGLALMASSLLRKRGVSTTVVDLHTIKPLDKETILKITSKTNLVVTIEEHNVIGGLGSAIAETIVTRQPKQMIIIGIEDVFGVSSKDYIKLLDYFSLTPEKISSRILRVLENVEKSIQEL